MHRVSQLDTMPCVSNFLQYNKLIAMRRDASRLYHNQKMFNDCLLFAI